MKMPHPHRRHSCLQSLEDRYCLSVMGFVSHSVECCAAYSAEAMAVGDIDGDGDPDVVAVDEISGMVWHENDGIGDFHVARRIGEFHLYEVQVSIADLDGDGDGDILVTGDSLEWFENVNGKEFAAPRSLSTSTSQVRSAIAADVDGDGDPDVVAISMSDLNTPRWTTSWYENLDGRGQFSPARVVQSNGVTFDGVAISVADKDNDGDLDILAATSPTAWYENVDGKGTFQRAETVTMGSSRALAVFDADGDGDNDVVTMSRENQLAWFENLDGHGMSGPPQRIIDSSVVDYFDAIVAADFDEDGDVDIVTGSPAILFENVDSKGAFAYRQTINERGGSVAVADVELDGDLDIVSMNFAVAFDKTTSIVWHANAGGTGVFVAKYAVDAHGMHDPSTLSVTDLDGDGDSDLLVSFTRDTIGWYENIDGRGSFSTVHVIDNFTLNSPFGGTYVRAGDIDGDGDLDLLSHVADEVGLWWNENQNAGGTFSPAVFLPIDRGLGNAPFELIDLDGDSDLDIFSIELYGNGPGRLMWNENTGGPGLFAASELIYEVDDNGINSYSVTDFDGDGDVDLLVAASRSMQLFTNNGTGAFATPRELFSDLSVDVMRRFFLTVDADTDGDIDFVWVDSETFFWRENELDAQFGFGEPVPLFGDNVMSYATSRALVDLDGDKDLDIVSMNAAQIVWYEQRLLGDVNNDGVFDSTDLVLVFQAGEYEDRILANSSFADGDWNNDGEFDSSDLVAAFQAGHYFAAAPATSDVAAAVDAMLAEWR
ncbi:MAG: VCBS repeat-containing protein [Planctomycetales bacterium]|nr:VCBS repeat-containing protein [Planctomycetales bacterium]